MKLRTQKRLGAKLLKAGKKRVKFNVEKLKEIKEAITRADVRSLIKNKIITKKQKKGISSGRKKKVLAQKRKGRRSGQGKRKGTFKARNPKKRRWINKIRPQRRFLKELKNSKIITNKEYRELYLKSKGNFFRSISHLELYLTKTMKKDLTKYKENKEKKLKELLKNKAQEKENQNKKQKKQETQKKQVKQEERAKTSKTKKNTEKKEKKTKK